VEEVVLTSQEAMIDVQLLFWLGSGGAGFAFERSQ
jgi:hypothetical protein